MLTGPESSHKPAGNRRRMPLEQLGRYEIIRELGHGAMGVVYKARDPLIDRIVAIKTIFLDLSNTESAAFEQRFYREAKSAGRLNHSNIVTIHDVGKSNAVAYIAMEFLDGQSLREILDSGVVLPPEKIVDIVAQVADGLAFAHEKGIVHRDIKPSNIMVSDSGSVKITDFGIALLPTGSRTVAGNVFGSPKYMSPEQVMGRMVNGRSDIFSLGTVLYEMLTGFPPFHGGDLNAVIDQVVKQTPPAPSSRNKGVAPVFDHIVAKATAKNPDDRYSTAQEMATDLRRFRDFAVWRPTGALPSCAARPLWPHCRIPHRSDRSLRRATRCSCAERLRLPHRRVPFPRSRPSQRPLWPRGSVGMYWSTVSPRRWSRSLVRGRCCRSARRIVSSPPRRPRMQVRLKRPGGSRRRRPPSWCAPNRNGSNAWRPVSPLPPQTRAGRCRASPGRAQADGPSVAGGHTMG